MGRPKKSESTLEIKLKYRELAKDVLFF